MNRFEHVRSMLESPIMDERKFGKIPSVPCDAVLVDMEDSVPLGRKDEGRARVIEAISDRSFFGDRAVIPRPNPLASPWGYEDLVALGQAGVDCMMYPKVRTPGDVLAAQRILRDAGADPDLVICVETPQAVAHVEELAALKKVKALCFGEGDLTAELGIPIHLPDGSRNPGLLPPRMRTIVAAKSAGIAMFDFAVLHNIKDLGEMRARAEEFAALGVTTICTIYPPHVDIANEVLTPGEALIEHAHAVVDAFDKARAVGAPAVQLDDGRTLLIHDYTKALRTLARSGRAR